MDMDPTRNVIDVDENWDQTETESKVRVSEVV